MPTRRSERTSRSEAVRCIAHDRAVDERVRIRRAGPSSDRPTRRSKYGHVYPWGEREDGVDARPYAQDERGSGGTKLCRERSRLCRERLEQASRARRGGGGSPAERCRRRARARRRWPGESRARGRGGTMYERCMRANSDGSRPRSSASSARANEIALAVGEHRGVDVVGLDEVDGLERNDHVARSDAGDEMREIAAAVAPARVALRPRRGGAGGVVRARDRARRRNALR